MSRRVLHLFIALALGGMAAIAGVPSSARAEAIPLEQAAAGFDIDAAEHKRALYDLFAMRGIRVAPRDNPTLPMVTRFLRADDQPTQYHDATALLFFAQHDKELTAYLVTKRGLVAAARTRTSAVQLERAVATLRSAMNVDALGASRAPRFRGKVRDGGEEERASRRIRPDAAAKALAGLLLPPELTAELGQVKHLIVVGNGLIGSTPFAMLPLGKGVIAERMSVSISASLFDIDQMIRAWGGRGEFGNALIVGDPLVPRTAEWDVPALPAARREAEAFATAMGREPLLGEAAGKTAVAGRLNQASVLYFAAHAVSDPREPLTGGFLMLSGPDAPGAFLTARELLTHKLKASLVVLSACQSGLGLNHEGGVIGLARTFQKVGAPRVVMSLWSVSDEATLFLMTRFQAHVMDTFPAEALRLAMLDARERYPDPALWAPFTLFGTPR